MKVTALKAREILDSRGIPTIEASIQLDGAYEGTFAVPSGASTGSTEVLEMRDGDTNRYFGKGTRKAVEIVNNEILSALRVEEFDGQTDFDNFLIELDGTPYKGRLGGNSILSVSAAFSKAAAQIQKLELYEYFAQLYWGTNFQLNKLQLPQPMILIMEGGKHGNWATDIQEFMVIPVKDKFPSIREAIRAGAEIFKATHDILVRKGYSGAVGFEGAFAPIRIKSNTEPFDLMLQGIEVAGYKPEEEILFALDVASAEFYDQKAKRYNLRREEVELQADEWMETQGEWLERYPIWSIEDPLDEEDWDNWIEFTKKYGRDHQIVGDDLLTTNTERIEKGISKGACNAVLIKLNQIGTVTETLNAIHVATEAGFDCIVSHRGGETNDDLIADLVVGTDANQSKFGGPDRGERVSKYNRLAQIEQDLRG